MSVSGTRDAVSSGSSLPKGSTPGNADAVV